MRRRQSNPPTLLVLLIAAALVFGFFYVMQGLQTFMQTGGLGIDESTQRAVIIRSATAENQFVPGQVAFTPRPTSTPLPDCQDFRVSVPAGIVRAAPALSAEVITQHAQGTIICVIARDPNSEFYTIDANPNTRRLDLAYMHETILQAINPTPSVAPTLTASNTVSPAPTVTITPSIIPTDTTTPLPSLTRDPAITDTPLPTVTPTPLPSPTPRQFQSA